MLKEDVSHDGVEHGPERKTCSANSFNQSYKWFSAPPTAGGQIVKGPRIYSPDGFEILAALLVLVECG